MKEVRRAPSRGGLVARVTSILAVLAACGGTTEPPETPPVDPTYAIDRSVVQIVEGDCFDPVANLIGNFRQEGDSLVFQSREDRSGGAGPLVWAGTIDGAVNFALRMIQHPFFGLTFERWTAEGSFTADGSSLTATERFRGILTDGRFCEAIMAWSGRRV